MWVKNVFLYSVQQKQQILNYQNSYQLILNVLTNGWIRQPLLIKKHRSFCGHNASDVSIAGLVGVWRSGLPEQDQTFAHRLLPPRTHLPRLHQSHSQNRGDTTPQFTLTHTTALLFARTIQTRMEIEMNPHTKTHILSLLSSWWCYGAEVSPLKCAVYLFVIALYHISPYIYMCVYTHI